MNRRMRLSTTVIAAAVLLTGGTALATAAPTVLAPQSVVPSETAAGGYTSLAPARILDTRSANGITTRTPIGSGRTVSLQVTGRGGVPASGVMAVVLNLTAVSPTASSGYLSAYPADKARPGVSSINWSTKGWVGANLITVPVSAANGKVNIYNHSGSTHIVADVMGFYRSAASAPATNGSYGSYEVADPIRVVDTRDTAEWPSPLPSNSYLYAAVDWGDVVNPHVKAFAVNITATQPKASGFLTAWDGVSTRPGTSSLNFTAGTTVANMAIVPVSFCTKCDATKSSRSLPQIGVFNTGGGSVHVIVDVVGIYDDNQLTGFDTYRYRSITPVRIVDSRIAQGISTIPARQQKTVVVPSSIVDGDTVAIVANLTAVAPPRAAVLTAWENNGTSMPLVSNLNPAAGQIVANMMMTALGPLADFNISNWSSGATNVLVDVAGTFQYYAVAPATAAAKAQGVTGTAASGGP